MPEPPLDINKLEKLKSDFIFQLKWQNQIFATMNGLPASKMMDITFPNPPYSPNQMNDFVASMKQHNIKQSSFQNLSPQQCEQQAKIQWLLNKRPIENKSMLLGWKSNLGVLFGDFQKVSIDIERERQFTQ